MSNEAMEGNFDVNDPNFSKKAVIYKLKQLYDKVEGDDKCTICEAIHILETPSDEKKDNSLWIMLIFFIFLGFSSDPAPFELISKILNDSISKSKEEEEK